MFEASYLRKNQIHHPAITTLSYNTIKHSFFTSHDAGLLGNLMLPKDEEPASLSPFEMWKTQYPVMQIPRVPERIMRIISSTEHRLGKQSGVIDSLREQIREADYTVSLVHVPF
jgi:hypothetical protein